MASTDADTLDGLLGGVWGALQHAVTTARAGFHVGTLAGVDEAGRPTARVMVLRGVELPGGEGNGGGGACGGGACGGAVWCHTDVRARKVGAFRARPGACWCFYDGPGRLQVRVSGDVSVHTDDAVADAAWAASSLSSRRCYLAPRAPGGVADQSDVNLPGHLRGRVPTGAESAAGRINFAVLRLAVAEMDVLHLAATGHRRARYVWDETGAVGAGWVEA